MSWKKINVNEWETINTENLIIIRNVLICSKSVNKNVEMIRQ